MKGASPPRTAEKISGLVEIREESEGLRGGRLDRLDAVAREVLDPRLREVVLDAVEDAAVHATMIANGPDSRMSHPAHLFGTYSPAPTHRDRIPAHQPTFRRRRGRRPRRRGA